jgi:hypothetical protein
MKEMEVEDDDVATRHWLPPSLKRDRQFLFNEDLTVVNREAQ